MFRSLLAVAFSLALPLAASQPRTLRLDYIHTGTDKAETFSLDRLILEPLPWPGASAQNLDTSNLGKYRFEVVDRATNQLLYSRGFCSIFGEWEITAEAKKASRAFSESLRFPDPGRPVQVILKKRDEANAFREIWSCVVDPGQANDAPPPSAGPLLELQKSGPSATKVDLLLLGDGYTAAERGKFEADARRMMGYLFDQSPYKEHRKDFNVWGLCPAAPQSGVDHPRGGPRRRTLFDTTTDAFGVARYALSFDNRAMRDAASQAPCEFLVVMANNQDYSNGGIFGLYALVSASNERTDKVLPHEFAHHFAGLADEYYQAEVAYETGKTPVEPWERNVTIDPRATKWADLLTPGVALPTPWNKQRYEDLNNGKIKVEPAAGETPFQARARAIRETVGADPKLDAGKVGAFEGANYESKGYYRSQTECMMFTFTRPKMDFCAVCTRALEDVIRAYTKQD